MSFARIKNIFAVWIILVLFHFSLHGIAVLKKFRAHSEIEMHRVESALRGQEMDERAIGSSRREKKKQSMIETILEFPLLPIIHQTDPKNDYYRGLEAPIELRFANSLAAGVFWYLVGFFITAFLPASSRWRRFFEGRSLGAKGVPKVFDKAPIIGMARYLEKSEGKRYGTVTNVAFIHLLLTGASNIFAVGARFDGSATPLFVKAMRLPLTPLLVDESFWNQQFQSQFVQPLVATANSALVGVLVAILFAVFRRRKESSSESSEQV